MTPTLVSREDWLAARKTFLTREKAFTQEREALAADRRKLPMVEVTESYEFQTEDGPKTLLDLFGDKSQLMTYHFMFGPDWEEGCPSCSYFTDSFERAETHLAARDTALVLVSNAPLEKLSRYRDRMDWSLRWVSAGGSSFGQDFGVTFGPEEMKGDGYNYGVKPYAPESPGLSVFLRLPDDRIAHSYSTYGRGLDILNTTYNLLDLTPKGRDEAALDYPMSWVRRRDMYEV